MRSMVDALHQSRYQDGSYTQGWSGIERDGSMGTSLPQRRERFRWLYKGDNVRTRERGSWIQNRFIVCVFCCWELSHLLVVVFKLYYGEVLHSYLAQLPLLTEGDHCGFCLYCLLLGRPCFSYYKTPPAFLLARSPFLLLRRQSESNHSLQLWPQ